MNIPKLEKPGDVVVQDEYVFSLVGKETFCAPRWAVSAYLASFGASPDEMERIIAAREAKR